MKFTVDNTYNPIGGNLIYRRGEYSFDFLPDDPTYQSIGGTTLCLDTLQIEVDPRDNRLFSVWGFHPYTGWIDGVLPPIISKSGGIKVYASEPLLQGSATPIKPSAKWKTIYDSTSGWVCVSQGTAFEFQTYIEFTRNVVVGIKDTELLSLWLKPTML